MSAPSSAESPSKTLYSESDLMDSEIRKTLQSKDYTISQETKQNYEKEEKDLREFFRNLRHLSKRTPHSSVCEIYRNCL